MSVFVSGCFDNIHAREVRFLEEAARRGPLNVALWSDALAQQMDGRKPAFPEEERLYFVESLRWVAQARVVDELVPAWLQDQPPTLWLADEAEDRPEFLEAAGQLGCDYQLILAAHLRGFPPAPAPDSSRRPGRKKVVVTGCYDWLHSGHVRFFEEAAAYGDLYVVVGNDANVENLKGKGHPLYPQDLRRYMAGAIRFVHQALITTGWGWMDAEPDIAVIQPDIYLVNEDGDRPEKRAFCAEHGLEYVVLQRLPRPGLTRRSSTDLRGF